jgi:hypothetical protein
MHSLRDVLKKSEETRVAIGHFNISDLVLLKEVFPAGSSTCQFWSVYRKASVNLWEPLKLRHWCEVCERNSTSPYF